MLVVLLGGAIAGFAIFGVMVYRAVTVEQAGALAAQGRFDAVRSAIGGGDPLLALDDEGRVVRRREPPAAPSASITRIGVLAYRASEERLIAVDVPFWFFRLKGPAAQYLVEGTGLDLERLRITASDLERHGPALVVDHRRPNGDLLLVWTE